MTVRPATPEDAPAVAALLAADEELFLGRASRRAAGDVAMRWAWADLDTGSWLFEEAGELVGAGWLFHAADDAFGFGVVAVGHKGGGLGGEIVRRCEARAVGLGARRLAMTVLSADRSAEQLLTARAYTPVRSFSELAIELTEAPAVPPVGDELTLDRFRFDDARAFHAALGDAFEDHWGFHRMPFEEWWDQKRSTPDFDPTLWFVVRNGKELAGVIRNEPERNGGGLVAALGVRRRWRGRGLGRALLLRSFREFFERGVTRVTLEVDTENDTGAERLYEDVGMTLELQTTVFERALP